MDVQLESVRSLPSQQVTETIPAVIYFSLYETAFDHRCYPGVQH